VNTGPSESGNIPPCICLAMLLADKVIREERTHKVHILGTFNSIFSQTFPTVHDTMHVYLALTEAMPGQHRGTLQMVYIDEGPDLEETQLMETRLPLSFSDRLQVLEFNLELRKVQFPKPGTLDLRFYLDDAFIASRRFKVVQRPAATPPAANGQS